jgi:hypothetical protein
MMTSMPPRLGASAREFLTNRVAEIAKLEQFMAEVLEHQTHSNGLRAETEVLHLINRLLAVHQSHIDRLDAHLATLRDENLGTCTLPSAPPHEMYFTFDPQVQEPAGMLRTDYTFLNLAAIGYTRLHTTAVALNHASTIDLALAHLRELTPLIMEISQAMPWVVIRELAHLNGAIVQPNAAEISLQATQDAWRNRTDFPSNN